MWDQVVGTLLHAVFRGDCFLANWHLDGLVFNVVSLKYGHILAVTFGLVPGLRFMREALPHISGGDFDGSLKHALDGRTCKQPTPRPWQARPIAMFRRSGEAIERRWSEREAKCPWSRRLQNEKLLEHLKWADNLVDHEENTQAAAMQEEPNSPAPASSANCQLQNRLDPVAAHSSQPSIPVSQRDAFLEGASSKHLLGKERS